jgi:hypothetical protein
MLGIIQILHSCNNSRRLFRISVAARYIICGFPQSQMSVGKIPSNKQRQPPLLMQRKPDIVQTNRATEFRKLGSVISSFSREAWVKTNLKKAMQKGGECGVGQMYSSASRFQSGHAVQSRS